MTMSMKIDISLNVVGTCCPMPLIELAEAMKSLKSGQRLQITGNDPVFERGMRDYCQAGGHIIIDIQVQDSFTTITIQK